MVEDPAAACEQHATAQPKPNASASELLRLVLRTQPPGVWTFPPFSRSETTMVAVGLSPRTAGKKTIRRRGATAERSQTGPWRSTVAPRRVTTIFLVNCSPVPTAKPWRCYKVYETTWRPRPEDLMEGKRPEMIGISFLEAARHGERSADSGRGKEPRLYSARIPALEAD